MTYRLIIQQKNLITRTGVKSLIIDHDIQSSVDEILIDLSAVSDLSRTAASELINVVSKYEKRGLKVRYFAPQPEVEQTLNLAQKTRSISEKRSQNQILQKAPHVTRLSQVKNPRAFYEKLDSI